MLGLDGATLPLEDRIPDFRVPFDSTLPLEQLVFAMARAVFFQLEQITQLHPFLEGEFPTMLVHAQVISKIDYCNDLYMGLPLMIWKLQQV